jgi:glycosyltransferase involved in cell wall biosynthesis
LFGGLGDWFHLKAVVKHPTVLTVVVPNKACDPALLTKVDRFVVEWPGALDDLVELGIDRDRVRLILPPVDLVHFHPKNIEVDRFTVLFASSPEREDWLEARGVPLLLSAAAQRPDWRFRLIWRPWGDALARVQRWVEERQLDNVDLVVGKFDNMASHYQQAHVTVAPFTDMDRCKAAPNSLVESLACGCPVVMTREVGLATVVQEANAGEICETESDELVGSLEAIRRDWSGYSQRARHLAEQQFCANRFVREYANVYQELIKK